MGRAMTQAWAGGRRYAPAATLALRSTAAADRQSAGGGGATASSSLVSSLLPPSTMVCSAPTPAAGPGDLAGGEVGEAGTWGEGISVSRNCETSALVKTTQTSACGAALFQKLLNDTLSLAPMALEANRQRARARKRHL